MNRLETNEQHIAIDAAQQLLQHDLQTQLNTCLVRLEYDISQRLGQQCLQKLQNHGLELLHSGRKVLQELIDQMHEALGQGFGQKLLRLEFQRQSGKYCNADRPAYVEDGYIYLYLPERLILGHILQQKSIHKVMLELLTDHVIRYIEKVYYRIEQRWQEFQSHYMVLDPNLQAPSLDNQLPSSPQHDISLDEDGIHNPNAEHLSINFNDRKDTASQIANRHRRLQQLQVFARSFWQNNFAVALSQLQLDLPDWKQDEKWPANTATQRQRVEPLEPEYLEQEQQIAFDVYYISILKELEQRCNLSQQRQSLLRRLRKLLEQSLEVDGFPFEAQQLQLDKSGKEILSDMPESAVDMAAAVTYCEYPHQNIHKIAELPDELAQIKLRYATNTWLYRAENLCEEQFFHLSQSIYRFFAEVEKSTRFQWIKVLPLLLCRSMATLRNFSKLPQSAAAETKLSVEPWLNSTTGSFVVKKNAALEELLQKPPIMGLAMSPIKPINSMGRTVPYASTTAADQSNKAYEVKLLLELLQRADMALQYQLQFRTSRKHYQLLKEMQQLRRNLLAMCHQPLYGSDVGIQITAFYRTVRKRQETYVRLDKILKNFMANCQLLN